MKFIYPSDYFNKNLVDECFREESEILKRAGFVVSILNDKKIEEGVYIYRGWMIDEKEYDQLNDLMLKNNSSLLISKEVYLSSHYLPNWYDKLKEYTPETIVTDIDNIEKVINESSWDKFFIKDYVKSLTTSNGSIANSKKEVLTIIEEINKKKGIVGGICIRKVIDFVKESEIRYFSLNKKIISPTGFIPEIVNEINEKIDSNFFSIDIIKDTNGKDWLVEIGDGQVSDLKAPWTNEVFVKNIGSVLKSKKLNKNKIF